MTATSLFGSPYGRTHGLTAGDGVVGLASQVGCKSERVLGRFA